MKIISIVIILLFFYSMPLSAQSITTIGLKGGGNISTFGPIGTGYTAKLGYHLGVFSSTRFYQELGMQAELLVSQQGARIQDISDLKLNYTYLDLPLIANIYFLESAAIEGGVQLGYLLKATQVDGGNKYDLSNEVSKVDVSGVLGINYSKPYGSIGFRYVLGINSVNNASARVDVRVTNKVLQLYIAKTLYSLEK